MGSGKSEILALPNLLSISRIIAAPFLFLAIKENKIIWIVILAIWAMISRIIAAPFLFLAIKENKIIWIVILAIWAMLSDFLDGLLARKLNLVSEAGKILDPLADKLSLAAVTLALAIYGDLPILLLALILARDLSISLFGIAIIKKIKVIPVSNIIGKFTVFVISVAMLIYIFKFERFYEAAYISSITVILISSLSYLIVGIKLISNKT